MNKKILTIIFGIILLTSGVYAANTISNLQGIDLPTNIIAGNTIEANFSFDYSFYQNENDSEMIVQLNFTSENDSYPVWRNDFEVNGYVQKCDMFILGNCWASEKIPFDCNNEEYQTISFVEGQEDIEALNGTFYCYTDEGNLEVGEHDNVFLEITPNYALFPGKYNLTALFYYLSDTYSPIVTILDKDYFNNYFGYGSYIEFYANIIDSNFGDNYESKILANYNISLSKEEVLNTDSKYRFFQYVPLNNANVSLIEGDYPIEVYARDEAGNLAKDNATIKFDFTAPTINVRTESIYDGTEDIRIDLDVADLKSDIKNETVQYMIREIINGTICPTNGVGVGFNCYNSGWTVASIDSIGYFASISSRENLSGEFWLQVKACDELNNCRVLDGRD